MKLRKILMSVITLVVVGMFGISQNVSNAATATTPMYLGITELMSNNTPHMGYAIGNPGDNTSGNTVAAKIWNIVKYSDANGSNPTDASIYCLKAGVGFSNTKRSETYDVFYDMKTEQAAIRAQNNVLKSIVDGGNYNEILTLLDLIYVKGQSLAEKENLLKAANINEEEWDVVLNEDDIKAVQQAAIWYFTNPDESVYDKYNNSGWMNYTLDGTNYSALFGYDLANETGRQKDAQVKLLYTYLIDTAKANAANYQNGTSSGAPAKVNTTTLNYEEVGNNYIVGPIKITEQNNTPYTIDFSVKNGNSNITNYSLLNQLKNSTNKDVKGLVGNDFYISIPKSSVTIENLKVKITINYNNTKLTLWGSNTNNSAQPVVIPEKEKKSVSVELTPIVVEKKFDLALRKYITKINGTALTGTSSRVPSIDESTLESGTTATYKHKKDPVTIKTGDVVTYKITIYNEGEKAGRATKVVDQLPTGLEFKRVVSGNFELDSYSANGDNKLNLKRKSSNTNNLTAYSEGNLDSETIEIECTVTAIADQSKTKILTNVAWISEEIDAEANLTITNQSKADRDSEPATTPSVNKNGLVTENNGYTGNGNKENLADASYYYKGQQDDDDFEKLILMPQSFDLKLIKRIVEVNGESVPERILGVDVSKLNTIGSDGKLVTTADYDLNKEPVKVKKGDIVTYTFRIYNEGTIDGYASEITEDIPEGLEFLWSEKVGTALRNDTTLTDAEKEAIEFNQNRYWTYADGTLKTIKTDYLSKENETSKGSNLIKAFGENDGTKTEEDISYKEVSVKLKVVSENEPNTIIRNEAEISEDTDKDGNPIDDRDSDTEKWVKYEDDEDYDNIILEKVKEFDLSLRKFIIAVSSDTTIENSEYLKNSDGSYTRAPVVDTSKLNTVDSNGKLITTATYNHTKEPVVVNVDDIVVYMLRVYNEGEIDGYAAEIKDHLPPYLEFVDGNFNKQYGWTVSNDGRTVTTTYLENSKITKATENSNGKIVIAYKEVPIMCKVKDTAVPNENITNIADITKYLDENKESVTDRDSEENNVVLPSDKDLPSYKDDETGAYVPGQEDDDDFEKVIVRPAPKYFDLSLRKFIIAVSSDTKIEDSEYLKNTNGTYTREPVVDTSKLNTIDSNGKLITTATYNHTKEPVSLSLNDVVVYMLRVYNEGEIDGYAAEIKDHLPPYLEFVDGDFNKQYGWTVSEDGRTVTTKYLENSKISKITENNNGKIVLDYKEVPIMCKVKDTAVSNENITNIADITKYLDENKESVTDRDSIENNVVLPADKDLPSYKDDETGAYVPGQEDDDDFEKVVVKAFDLALRKFIVAISNDTKIEDSEYLKNEDGTYTREPIVDTSKLNTVGEDGKLITTATYTHTKEPVLVKLNDNVIYMLRAYNEGEIDGYAAEIKDHLPSYLEFVDGDFNKQYGWTVSEDGRTVTTKYLENSLIRKAEANSKGEIVLDYKEVPIMCKVKDTAKSNENITNIADITKYLDEDKKTVKDRDSEEDNVKLPDDKDLPSYGENQQDDDDYEKVVVKTFDLALRKWVTQAIVTENGKTTVKNTGHKPYDDPEQVVKVELNRKKLSSTTVKFRYSIRVINEGDVEGYAKEVTDYIPQGLKFVAADNPGWTDEGNNVISTRLLENKLLKPGEYADVEVLLTWINGQNNMGLKTNTAEISEDYNKYGLPDKDSTPDNKKSGEDDIDDAPVMLSVSTGQVRIYFGLGFAILITIAGGVVLIKKYIL